MAIPSSGALHCKSRLQAQSPRSLFTMWIATDSTPKVDEVNRFFRAIQTLQSLSIWHVETFWNMLNYVELCWSILKCVLTYVKDIGYRSSWVPLAARFSWQAISRYGLAPRSRRLHLVTKMGGPRGRELEAELMSFGGFLIGVPPVIIIICWKW